MSKKILLLTALAVMYSLGAKPFELESRSPRNQLMQARGLMGGEDACEAYAMFLAVVRQHQDMHSYGLAALHLAECHQSGMGCDSNVREAISWYRVATTCGHADIMQMAARKLSELSPGSLFRDS